MSFGRNPHVAKAEAAEQKAECAKDVTAREQAWRDAARQWERASERETDDGRRRQYAERAEAARKHADHPEAEGGEAADVDAPKTAPSGLLNLAARARRRGARRPATAYVAACPSASPDCLASSSTSAWRVSGPTMPSILIEAWA